MIKRIVLLVLTLSSMALASGDVFEETDALGPREFVIYTFHAKGVTTYVVQGDGGGNIDCALSTVDGKRLETDHGPEDGCAFASTGEGIVRFKLHNRGDAQSIYRIRASRRPTGKGV